jgi:hypothetical protein
MRRADRVLGYELVGQAPAELSGRAQWEDSGCRYDGWWSDPWWGYSPERGWACIRWWKPVAWQRRAVSAGPRVIPWPFEEEAEAG